MKELTRKGKPINSRDITSFEEGVFTQSKSKISSGHFKWDIEFLGKNETVEIDIYSQKMIKFSIAEKLKIDTKFLRRKWT